MFSSWLSKIRKKKSSSGILHWLLLFASYQHYASNLEMGRNATNWLKVECQLQYKRELEHQCSLKCWNKLRSPASVEFVVVFVGVRDKLLSLNH